MLLDTTVTDSDKNCSLYNRSSILPAVDALNKRDDLAQKRGTMLYWIVSGTSEHVSYAILESDHIDKSHTVFARSVRNAFSLQNHAAPHDKRSPSCPESMSANDVRSEISTVHQTMITQMGTLLP
jgi:hypothetical protein